MSKSPGAVVVLKFFITLLCAFDAPPRLPLQLFDMFS
jgi:hypothetical protein